MKLVRPLGFAALLGLAVLGSAPGTASAQHGSWLMEYLSGWYGDPPMINAKQPTTITLWGWFPYHCGEVANAIVVDSGHVQFDLRPGPACSDTVTVWHQSFPLGLLPAGWHTLHIRRLFYASVTDSGALAEASFDFYVEPDSAPPPPPQHRCREFGSTLIRGLSGWYTNPVSPTAQIGTTLVLWGWFPYPCGEVADPMVLAPDHVRLTLRPGPPCTDTVSTWSQPFNLGVLSEGQHLITAELIAVGDSCDTSRVRVARIPLYLSNQVVTPSVPNPFVTETSFIVTNVSAGLVDVGIHDLAGRRVVTLYHGDLPQGSREFRWNAKRADGTDAPIGIYFSRVAFSNRVVTQRLVMIPRR